MSRDVVSVTEQESLEAACEVMKQKKLRRVLIYSPDRTQLRGILSLDDVVTSGRGKAGEVLAHVVEAV